MTIADNVIDRACEMFGYSREQVLGRGRRPEFAEVRFAIMATLHRHGWSSPKVGNAVGRDHSTVLHGVRRAHEIAARDPGYADILAELAEVEEAAIEPAPDILVRLAALPELPKPKPKRPAKIVVVEDESPHERRQRLNLIDGSRMLARAIMNYRAAA